MVMRYKENTFRDYIELLDYMIRVEEHVNEKLFPGSNIFHIRYHLQEKFNRRFTIKAVKQLITEELALKNITLF
jgi:hypothetical protein